MPDDLPRPTLYALPGILQEIARFSTTDVAIAIAREWGGRRLYVPRSLDAGHRLARIIGRKAALLVCEHLGGDHHVIPSARTYLRWYDARRLKTEGRSVAQISKAIGVSQRQVQILLAGFEPDEVTATEGPGTGAETCSICGHRLRAPAPRQPDPRQPLLPGLP